MSQDAGSIFDMHLIIDGRIHLFTVLCFHHAIIVENSVKLHRLMGK